MLVCAAFAAPALALDKKLDPDPAFLAKARTAATATVEPHYDLMSDKVPFWARFLICAGQLTAARDEGRALPVPQADLDKLIADYRGRAAELVAYRQKADAKAPATDVDAEIAKIRSGAMQFLPADTTKLGVEHMKKLHGQRVAFCQLTRDWYEVQNGIRTATARRRAAEAHQAARRGDAQDRRELGKAADAARPQADHRPADRARRGTAAGSDREGRGAGGWFTGRRRRRARLPRRQRHRAAQTRGPTSPDVRCGRRSPNVLRGWS